MKLEKKVVSKRTYIISTLIYHSLCLSGLIWQVTNISTNFFRFEVIKDINVILPEELKNEDLILNICFENSEILYKRRYDLMFLRKMKRDSAGYIFREKDSRIKTYLEKFSFQDRFAITPNASDFMTARLFDNVSIAMEFIFDHRYCYQIDAKYSVTILSDSLKEVTSISIMRGQKLPHFDHRRLASISSLGEVNKARNFYISSFMYALKREKWPYQENCIHYARTGSRLNAISDCMNEKMRSKGTVYKTTTMQRTQSLYMNYSAYVADETADNMFTHCERLHSNLECDQKIYLTKVEGPKVDRTSKESYVKFDGGEDRDISFIIISRPRIDNIDYVTYILGALGAWIGFSFIAINPIPYVMTTGENVIAPVSDRTVLSISIALYRELIKSKRIIYHHHQLFKNAKRDRDQLRIENHELRSKVEAISMRVEGLYQDRTTDKIESLHNGGKKRVRKANWRR